MDDIASIRACTTPNMTSSFGSGVTVAELDRRRREVVLDNGVRVGYDRLLLATGAQPRQLDVPGCQLAGIVSLRTLNDADDLRRLLASAGQVVVVGGGWIGTEVRRLRPPDGPRRHDDPPRPRSVAERDRTRGRRRVPHAAQAQHGVKMRMSTDVVAFEGTDAVRSAWSPMTATASLLISSSSAVGATPRVDLAAAAGLEVDNGIVVDQFLRTKDEAIYRRR